MKESERLKLREYKNQLNTLKEHNDDHIIQSDLEDAIREIEENIKMSKYEKATEIITDYISNDMDYKDRYSEILWLLKEVYPKNKLDDLKLDWNLDDEDQWGENIASEFNEGK